MTAHTCTTLTEGCYRCDLNRDEIAAIEAGLVNEAEDAWFAYRDDYMRTHHLSPRRASSQMRRREFIAGYMAANA